MQVMTGEMNVMFDVDDTLVMWSDKYREPHEGTMFFEDPYDSSGVWLKPHFKHIELMRKYKGRGYNVIVWSAGGVLWAESVIKTLQLTDIVDLVMTKSVKYVDDLPASEILGTRVYIDTDKKHA